MPLTPIGDIASGGLAESVASGTLTWETATDWDSAVSESQVVHETTGDYSDTDVQQGYPASPFASLVSHYPLHEDSGTSFADAGGVQDGNINGSVTLGANGVLNATSFDFPGTDGNYCDIPYTSSHDLSTHTVLMLINITNKPGGSDYDQYITRRDGAGSAPDSTWQLMMNEGQQNDEFRYTIGSGSNFSNVFSASNIVTGTWYLVGCTYDTATGDQKVWVDGNNDASASPNYGSLANGSSQEHYIGARADLNSGKFADARICHYMIFDTALGASEWSTLYDTLSSGTLTTATKSFAASTKPDLQNLSYTLNGETASLDIIGSPGTASEEIVTQSLTGATSYSLTWSNSHTDFRVKIDTSSSSVPAAAVIGRVELA